MSDLQFPTDSLRYPEENKGMTALVLGIVGVVFAGSFLGVVGLIMATKEIRAIEEGRRSPEGLQMAKTARILGIVSCVLLLISVIAIFVLMSVWN